MKTLVSLSLVCLLAAPILASIDPGAPSASHHMEETAAALHSYLHDFYESSYGAHGLETDSDAIHGRLHDWSNGNASEAEVAADMDALDASWKNFKQTIHQAQVLNSGDDTLDDMFNDAKDAYKTLRFLLKNVEG